MISLDDLVNMDCFIPACIVEIIDGRCYFIRNRGVTRGEKGLRINGTQKIFQQTSKGNLVKFLHDNINDI